MDLPNLFEKEFDAIRLYLLFLARLDRAGLYSAVVETCNQIKEYAKTTFDQRDPSREGNAKPNDHLALFVYGPQRQALVAMGEFDGAWDQLLEYETLANGRKRDLNPSDLSEDDAHFFLFDYAPLLYFRGEFEQGASLKERGIEFAINHWDQSEHFLDHVYSARESEPSRSVDVSLMEIYKKLGKKLQEWNVWSYYVSQFSTEVLKAAGAEVREIVQNPELLETVATVLAEQRIQQQHQMAEENLEWESRHRAKHLEIERRLLSHFPMLRDCPSRCNSED